MTGDFELVLHPDVTFFPLPIPSKSWSNLLFMLGLQSVANIATIESEQPVEPIYCCTSNREIWPFMLSDLTYHLSSVIVPYFANPFKLSEPQDAIHHFTITTLNKVQQENIEMILNTLRAATKKQFILSFVIYCDPSNDRSVEDFLKLFRLRRFTSTQFRIVPV